MAVNITIINIIVTSIIIILINTLIITLINTLIIVLMNILVMILMNILIISSILGNLSNMAVSMGSEIEKQNSQLDNIQGKVRP